MHGAARCELDVSYHKTLEHDPALALRLLDTLLTRAPVGFVFLDRDLRFVRINDQLAEINGLSVEAHLGRTVTEVLPAFELVLRGVTDRILATGQPVIDHEFSGETPREPGIKRCWNESWYPVRDEHDEVIGFGGVVVEITARKHAEATLRETQLQYQALAEASAEIPCRMSADWSTMLALDGRGVFESSLRPRDNWTWMEQYIPRDEQARLRQSFTDAIARKALFDLEHRVLRADGTTGWVRSRAVPIFDENEVLVTWFGVACDITERKQIELHLIEATAIAEAANRAKSVFLSSMSHELRTPLNSILGFAQLMESGTPAPTPVQKRSIEHILKGGWYLLSLIDELLDLALVESGKLSLSMEPVSLANVMLECRAMVEPLANKRGIKLGFAAAEAPGFVRADRTRLKQVLINLLTNAIKYNKPQGAVAIEYALGQPGSIRISIQDSGEGLTTAKLAQLFQPFNRLGKETGAEEGTGIGLVMSRRLVELMGGTIGAESTVGIGSVFWFELETATAPQVV